MSSGGGSLARTLAGISTPPAGPSADAPPSTTPPAPATPDVAGIPDWAKGAGDAAKKRIAEKNWPTLDSLVQSYDGLETILGKRATANIAPTADSTPEEVENFYRSMGKPEKPEGYKMNVPDGVPINKGLLERAPSLFHRANLTEAQAEILLNGQIEYAQEEAKAAAEAKQLKLQEGVTALQKSWAGAFDEKMDLADSAMKAYPKFFDEETVAALRDLKGAEWTFSLLSELGKPTREAPFRGGDSASPVDAWRGMTPQDAARRHDDIMQGRDPDFEARFLKKDPRALAEMEFIHKRKSGK